jgi:hypothetical protein
MLMMLLMNMLVAVRPTGQQASRQQSVRLKYTPQKSGTECRKDAGAYKGIRLRFIVSALISDRTKESAAHLNGQNIWPRIFKLTTIALDHDSPYGRK